MRKLVRIARRRDGEGNVFVPLARDPVVHADSMQDHGPESPDTGAPGQRYDRDALPQCFDRGRAGIMRKWIEGDVDAPIGRPGPWLRCRCQQHEARSCDAMFSEPPRHEVAEGWLPE